MAFSNDVEPTREGEREREILTREIDFFLHTLMFHSITICRKCRHNEKRED
jgi:hypothetical protein